MKKKSNKRKGMDFETKCQKSINSGALSFSPGDLSTDQYCIECKITDKASYRITSKTLEKIWSESLDANKLPLMIIGINGEEYRWKLMVTIEKERV